MLINRVLFLGGLAGLAACSSPTAPDESVTTLPPAATPGGHFQPFGVCTNKVMTSQLCAPISGRK
jgi:hypothetical protein